MGVKVYVATIAALCVLPEKPPLFHGSLWGTPYPLLHSSHSSLPLCPHTSSPLPVFLLAHASSTNWETEPRGAGRGVSAIQPEPP